MCGLTGFLDPGGKLAAREETLRAMTRSLVHRGPDDEGIWLDNDAGIGLGHRRLSILDLSSAGHQPMTSHCGRWLIAYNGEIYNHLDLRRDLEQQVQGFRGHSDTETLVNAIAVWGLAATLQRCNGMFAIAAWDREERRLWLARDRAGKKPLYYAPHGQGVLFASELRALYQVPGFRPEIDRQALTLYLRHNHVPGPRTIFEQVRKLPAGTLLELSASRPDHTPQAYWSAAQAARQAQARPFEGSLEDALKELDGLTRDATRLRMLSDVPLGVFLSGGIDSSLVTACMQAQSDQPVRSFSIGFQSEDFDEAGYARSVADHLGTEHTELYVTDDELLDSVPRMAGIYDEPFADSSQIPSWLVSRMARRDVTVALSGDGGDELFGGYERYVFGAQRWERMARIPLWLRQAVCRLGHIPPLGLINGVLGAYPRADRDLGARLRQRLEMATAESGEALHRALVSDCLDPARLVNGGGEPAYLLAPTHSVAGIEGLSERMMLLDHQGWLVDDLLVKMDRASMAVSLEVRAPLLDYRLFEFAWSLPAHFRFDEQGGGKLILRRLLGRYLPASLYERPKQGFCVPVAEWLRGPLRDWAEDLLAADLLARQGYLNAKLVRRRWQDHLQGRQDWSDLMWNVLMFQAWQAQWSVDRAGR